MNNVYQIITERITNALKGGTVPWVKPWNGTPIVPTSLATGKAYRGVNRWLLDPAMNGFASPYWLTYKQAAARGGQVRSGAKGTPCVFWKILDDKRDPKKKVFLLRYYTVFNVEQCDGIVTPEVPTNTQWNGIESAEAIVNGWANRCTVIHNGGDRCFYRPATDTISMADKCAFSATEAYYAVLFHEMIHATGHPSRLDRELTTMDRGSYAKEELIAELGSAFLCADAGISNTATITNTEAYIAGWLKALNNDPTMIVSASAAAQRAVESIKGIHWNDEAAPATDE